MAEKAMSVIIGHIPSELSLLPQGQQCLDTFKGSLDKLQQSIDQAVLELQKKSDEANKTAEHVAEVVTNAQGVQMGQMDKDKDVPMQLSDEQVNAVIDDILGERDDAETPEHYSDRKQVAKQNFRDKAMVRISKLKQAAKK